MPDLPSEPQERSRKRATAKIMKRARTVQLSMLPKTPAIEGLDLFAHYAPCDAVGGDFYDFVPVSPWEIGIVMGDVAGHGVDAAADLVRERCRRTIARVVQDEDVGHGQDTPDRTAAAPRVTADSRRPGAAAVRAPRRRLTVGDGRHSVKRFPETGEGR